MGDVIEKTPTVTRTLTGDSTDPDTFVKASANGAAPGAPVDPAVPRREERPWPTPRP